MAERPISIDRLRSVSNSDETSILIGRSTDAKAAQSTIFFFFFHIGKGNNEIPLSFLFLIIFFLYIYIRG